MALGEQIKARYAWDIHIYRDCYIARLKPNSDLQLIIMTGNMPKTVHCIISKRTVNLYPANRTRSFNTDGPNYIQQAPIEYKNWFTHTNSMGNI